MAKVDKDTVIIDVLKMDKGTTAVFMKYGMHCVGCPSASGESIEAACAVHGIDADALVKDLNDFLDKKED